jgi:hypothetical protein
VGAEMKISVEFLLAHKSDVYDVGRIPCLGEYVSVITSMESCYEVKEVIHLLNADPTNQVLAIVRVR